jgi:flagellar basal body rod protein FlgF
MDDDNIVFRGWGVFCGDVFFPDLVRGTRKESMGVIKSLKCVQIERQKMTDMNPGMFTQKDTDSLYSKDMNARKIVIHEVGQHGR